MVVSGETGSGKTCAVNLGLESDWCLWVSSSSVQASTALVVEVVRASCAQLALVWWRRKLCSSRQY